MSDSPFIPSVRSGTRLACAPVMPLRRRLSFWVAILMVALLALGPYLHAHVSSQPVNSGLHRHLGVAGFAVPQAAAGAQQNPLAVPESNGDDGSAVYVTTSLKRDLELLSPIVLATVIVLVGLLMAMRPAVRRAVIAPAVVPRRCGVHWRPFATAPPQS